VYRPPDFGGFFIFNRLPIQPGISKVALTYLIYDCGRSGSRKRV
jgi:hypothetical protein